MSQAVIGDMLADYAVVQMLGTGGNGVFYLAHPPTRLGLTAEFVVLKVFDGPCAADAYRRGVRELRAFASVGSPYLARVFDAVLDGSFMYAMEYFPDGSLREAAPRLSRDRVLAAMADVAEGTHALHEAGIAHGNLTPSNVMLVPGGGRVADLGMSRVLASDTPLTSFAPCASIRYTDPAIFAGAAPSRATDIWSLGACLHHGLTGTGVYTSEEVSDPVIEVRSVLAALPRVAPALDSAAAGLVASCLGMSGARPATAREVAEQIRELL